MGNDPRSMATLMNDDRGNELRRIVRINEEIKHVVVTARKINLMAMNAIFLAKRAGHSALGYGVLSNELRRFAHELQAQMTRLRQATHDSVVIVTARLKQARLDLILARAHAAAAGQGRMLIEAAMRERQQTEIAAQRACVVTLDRRLSQMIADTAQLAEMGSVLARSAKIEAAYGGPFMAALMQVASDFERTIGDIRHSLEALVRNKDDSR